MRRALVFSVLTVCAACAAGASLQAGVAVRVVTPDPLLPVSGGVGVPKKADRALGDLTVRALVLARGDTRVAFVGGDFLGFPGVLCDRVRARVAGIAPENILIGSTHTHSAPDTYGFMDEQGRHGADLDYLDLVCDRMAGAVNEALASVEPVALKAATGEAADGIAYNYYAEALFDPRCDVLQFVRDDGSVLATLVNYAVHPEVIGNGQGILTPDLAGPLYDRIAERGGGTALFMNGALGGMVTADCRGPDGKDVQTWDECVRIGRLLADEALRIVADAPLQRDPALACTARTVRFPVDSPMMRAIIASSPLGMELDEEERVYPVQVNCVTLGNTQILTVPGEAMPNIGFYLKRKMHGEHNLLFGLTNDAIGYILVREDYDSFARYRYITRTSLGEQTGPLFVEEALALVDASPRPERLQP
jgi:hypothetical protein